MDQRFADNCQGGGALRTESFRLQRDTAGRNVWAARPAEAEGVVRGLGNGMGLRGDAVTGNAGMSPHLRVPSIALLLLRLLFSPSGQPATADRFVRPAGGVGVGRGGRLGTLGFRLLDPSFEFRSLAGNQHSRQWKFRSPPPAVVFPAAVQAGSRSSRESQGPYLRTAPGEEPHPTPVPEVAGSLCRTC